MIDFNKLIDQHLARESYPKKIGRYYPSEIGYCLRKAWYSYKKPKPTDNALIRIFEAGNILHEFIEEVIISEKNPEVELLQKEVPVKIKTKDFTISGRIDNLILAKIENKIFLVEVKSCKYLPKEFRKENEMQLQLYLKAAEVQDGMLLYIQKDNLETRWFNIPYDEEKANEILKRFDILHDSLVKETLPEAEAKHDEEKKWLCNKCPWKEECWARED
ncbi:MAG TPA: PD-(D/E)XK nuclease family protein [Candidatus Paceibacterota bacterium]|nr:PD-(D/E)XK nuclease family protein [Candidatus Paceibacterota bacterium]